MNIHFLLMAHINLFSSENTYTVHCTCKISAPAITHEHLENIDLFARAPDNAFTVYFTLAQLSTYFFRTASWRGFMDESVLLRL